MPNSAAICSFDLYSARNGLVEEICMGLSNFECFRNLLQRCKHLTVKKYNTFGVYSHASKPNLPPQVVFYVL
jgi:hypothetical protein